MPKIFYVHKNFRADALEIIENANSIIEEYQSDGFDLTLRQLFYQFVSRGLIPNKDSEYKRLGSIISDARLAGLIDWTSITDRTRNLRGNSHWDSPADIVRTCSYQFEFDKWKDQDNHVECWVEKQALEGVLERICGSLDVSFFSCKGYVSQSEMWAAAQRLSSYEHKGKTTYVLHLGDHDPSGIDMTRDIEERLHLFGSDVEVKRIALNMDQVKAFNPPPNPAKITDTRSSAYIAKFGHESWELDALDPKTLSRLVEENVVVLRDQDKWEAYKEKEEEAKKKLSDFADELEEQE